MTELKNHPFALQLLMQTDGTVTDLIKVLTNEPIVVKKLSEKVDEINDLKVLHRRIFLQGEKSQINWMYAQSQIFLDHLPVNFVRDLTTKNIPIGTLWTQYRMETFKELVCMNEEFSKGLSCVGYEKGKRLLSRQYYVYNNGQLIMKITEKFPIAQFVDMI